jgi:hypothetical protein
MKRAPHIAVTLAVVYLLLSFNAYACLIPLYGGVQAATGSDCAMPQEQPVRDACDAFKTIGVQAPSAAQPLPVSVSHVVASDLGSVLAQASLPIRQYDRSGSPSYLQRDLLSLTSILRI